MGKLINISATICNWQYRHLNDDNLLNLLSYCKENGSDNFSEFSEISHSIFLMNFGDEGDFESGAKYVSFRDEKYDSIKKFSIGDDSYLKGFEQDEFYNYSLKYVENCLPMDWSFEFKTFNVEDLSVEYYDSGLIELVDFGDSNFESMVSAGISTIDGTIGIETEQNLSFEFSEEDYDDKENSIEIFSKDTSSLDIQWILEELNDGKDVKKILEDIRKNKY